jgi:hypothetical protein
VSEIPKSIQISTIETIFIRQENMFTLLKNIVNTEDNLNNIENYNTNENSVEDNNIPKFRSNRRIKNNI